jgi:hypothetical protein
MQPIVHPKSRSVLLMIGMISLSRRRTPSSGLVWSTHDLIWKRGHGLAWRGAAEAAL